MKLPSYLRTHTFIKRLVELISTGRIAQACGKESQTIDAWTREPASNANPSGTGKHNPIDCVLRLQGLAHKEGDTALAREIAEIFSDYADYLEGEIHSPAPDLVHLAQKCIKEHGEAVIAALEQENPNFARAHTEIVQAELALHNLRNGVKDRMKAPLVDVSIRNGLKGAVNNYRHKNGVKA